MRNKVWGVFFLGSGILIIAAFFFLSNSTQEVKEETKKTLKWYVNFSWFNTEWGQDIVSKKISDEIGVDIEFVVPKGNESGKMSSMIHLDTVPDIVTLGWWEGENQELIEQDQVYSYQELEEQYQAGFFEVADEESVQWYTQKDGHLYGYPNYSFSWKDFEKYQDKVSSHQNFLVRKDIYEAIGKPDMSTPEGFMEAVKKAKEMFPEVNGEPLIPIGSDEFTETGSNSFGKWLQNFLAVPYEKNGEYYDRNTDPEYIRWLKVFRKLGEEGYLNAEVFIDNRTQISEKILDGRYFCLIYQSTDIKNQEKEIYTKEPNKIYMAVEGPRNSKGDDPVLACQGINGWTTTYISKNCKYPEKALELLTYMLSEEGQKLMYLGEKDTMYHIEDGKEILNKEVLEVLHQDRKRYDSIYGADDTYWMMQSGEMQMQYISYEPEYFKQLVEWTIPYIAYVEQYEIYFGDNEEFSNIQNNLNRIWGNTLVDLLLAPNEEEFEKRVNQYKKERTTMGYSKFKKAATQIIKQNKEKLGIEE